MSLIFNYRVAFQKGDSQAIIPLGTLGPGTYLAKIDSRGFSLLSTLFVLSKDVGAAISVNYLDFTAGGEVGEESSIGSHFEPVAGQADRILVSNMHNKPFARITVTGGNVTFSLYGTALTNASDAALVKDIEAALIKVNFGMGMAGLDRANQIWRLLSVAPDGSLLTTDSSTGGGGVGKILESSSSLSVGPVSPILTQVVPAGKTWAVAFADVVTRGYGRWEVFLDAVRIGSGITGPGTGKRFVMPKALVANAGQTLNVQFEYSHGPSAMVVDAFIGVLET